MLTLDMKYEVIVLLLFNAECQLVAVSLVQFQIQLDLCRGWSICKNINIIYTIFQLKVYDYGVLTF